MTSFNFPSEISFLFSPKTIREKSQIILNKSLNGKGHFEVNLDNLSIAAQLTVDVTKENYPSLKIPYHCRNNHFKVGHTDKLSELMQEIKGRSQQEKIATLIDLNIFSVLIDAGAGNGWRYFDVKSNQIFERSEGLAIASINAFTKNTYFPDLAITSNNLISLNVNHLEEIFQVKETNPIVGLNGRLQLLNNLGKQLQRNEIKSAFPNQRISDPFINLIKNNSVDLKDVLQTLIYYFNDIWPSRYNLQNTNLGDCWFYPYNNEDQNDPQNYIPFHKLFQWLSYSLAAVYEQNGIKVENVESLTGLPEYRNGGLFVDTNVISFRDKNKYSEPLSPSSNEIIEWRALTICLLDKMHPEVCKILNLSPKEFYLPNMLEGGSWAAGRKIAKGFRDDMSPPINIQSDGTVF
ncbi:URC4/urg3 family protein [Bacteriovoracaceae bacterium]|nr:URC4/urg3 family protein [Bacteriovoracaceae bacterium]